MLLASSSRRTVLVLPLLLILASCAILAFSVLTRIDGKAWSATLGLAVFGGLVGWAALSELAVVSVAQGSLRVRGLGRRSELDAGRVAFGVQLRSGSRSARFVVFASDGNGRVDVADWASEAAARRGVQRLSAALLAPTHLPADSALRDVQSVELEWQAGMAKAMDVVNSYYQSASWRRVKVGVIVVLVCYVLGTAGYAFFTGQL